MCVIFRWSKLYASSWSGRLCWRSQRTPLRRWNGNDGIHLFAALNMMYMFSGDIGWRVYSTLCNGGCDAPHSRRHHLRPSQLLSVREQVGAGHKPAHGGACRAAWNHHKYVKLFSLLVSVITISITILNRSYGGRVSSHRVAQQARGRLPLWSHGLTTATECLLWQRICYEVCEECLDGTVTDDNCRHDLAYYAAAKDFMDKVRAHSVILQIRNTQNIMSLCWQALKMGFISKDLHESIGSRADLDPVRKNISFSIVMKTLEALSTPLLD